MSAIEWLALTAIVPAGATVYFVAFWRWFAWWRRHRLATYVMMFGTLAATALAVGWWHRAVFAQRVALPWPLVALGWVLVAAGWVLGWVADRQIGLRVRSFAPFFDEHGRIALVTGGAYAVVRHPIYAAGIAYQLGVALVSGQAAVAIAAVVFAGGARWFTAEEERRLIALLDDPAAYQRYRARVPRLCPWPRP